VSIIAAFVACAVTSLILFGSIDRSSFAPLGFAIPGSLFLLATAYAALKEAGRSLIWSYAALTIIGAAGGSLMLGFISIGHLESTVIGGFYGLMTALCWIALHALTRKFA